MAGIEVSLEWSEILQAGNIGLLRQAQNIFKGRKNAHGLDDGNDWQLHIEGALGEYAVSKYLGIFWNGSLGKLKNTDVGEYEVRTASSHLYNLIVHPGDKDDKPFVLVTGANGSYIIHGWILGKEAKDQKFWKEPVKNRPAYFVPKSALHPMSELPLKRSESI